MHKNTHTIILRGVVLEEGTGRAVAGLRVETWDADLVVDDFLGSATSDAQGRFEIAFDEDHYRELFFDRTPDVYFKVFDGGTLIRNTRRRLERRIAPGVNEVSVTVPRHAPLEPLPPPLDRHGLLALQAVRNESPAMVSESDPKLHAALRGVALRALRVEIDSVFADASAELRRQLATFDIAALADPNRNVAAALRESLLEPSVPEAVRREGLARLQRSDLPASIADVLHADVPLRENALFAADLARADLEIVTAHAGLPTNAVASLEQHQVNLTSLDDVLLGSLVNDGVLDPESARRLGATASLYRWTGNDIQLVRAIEKEIGTERPNLERLTSLRQDDWTKLVGDSSAERAKTLARSLELLFPEAALATQIGPVEVGEVEKRLVALAPALADKAFADLDLSDAAFVETRRLVNRHPGLELSRIIDDRQLSPGEKAARIARRVGWLESLRRANPKTSFVLLDTFSSEQVDALDFGNVPESDRELVVEELRTDQRMLKVTDGRVEDTFRLKEAGFSSAIAVARKSADAIASQSAIGLSDAEKYLHTARDLVRRGLDFAGILIGRLGDHTPAERDDPPSETDALLRRLPGFADYFGNQAHCRCVHCRSLLSPAAYFVDLMEFVEDHIGTGRSAPASDPYRELTLYHRRSDLWSGVPLTCEHTETLIPYLQIIVEILENYVYSATHAPPLPSTRASIEGHAERVTYERGTLEQPALNGFAQPFCLPLDRLDTYLAHFPTTRSVVAERVLEQSEADALAAARLGMSEREYALTRRPDTRTTFLQALYQLDVGDTVVVPATGALAEFDTQRLLAPMGVDRQRLTELLATRWVRQADDVRVEGRRRDSGSVQPDVEVVLGMTSAVLDRMHRFQRLSRRLPWTPVELDLVLEHAGAGTGGELPLTTIASLLTIQKRLQLGVEDICALFDQLPSRALTDDGRSAFDRAFNGPPFVRSTTDAWPATGSAGTFVHPAFASGTSADDVTLHRLLSGLGVNDEELLVLLGPSAESGFGLERGALSRLYQHARLASRLRIPIADWLRVLELFGASAATRITSVAELERRIAILDRWRKTKLTLDELEYVTGGTSGVPAEIPNQVLARIIANIDERRALVFADTVFAFFDGVTEEQSRRILESNLAAPDPIFERDASGPRRYRLTARFDPTVPLAVPTDITRTATELHAWVGRFHPVEIVPPLLASELGVSLEKLLALLRIAGHDPTRSSIRAEWVGIFRGDAPVTRLIPVVTDSLRLAMTFAPADFTPTAVDFVAAHSGAPPRLFEISDFTNLRAEEVAVLREYGALLSLANETALHTALVAFDGTRFGSGGVLAAAELLAAEPGLVAGVDESISLPSSAVSAFTKLQSVVALTQDLGVSGEVLPLIASPRFDELDRAASAIYAAFRARYVDEATWLTKIEPFRDRILERRRDALSDYIIRTLAPNRFRSGNDLYHWFLIDTQLEGCARTSRVVAATSSLQLYVQRCLMRLEQSEDGARHTEVDGDGAQQWPWRKNYRLWEANRKVFLFPEAYLDQEFRDDKTELFRQIESRLLQNPVDAESVFRAYTEYLGGFAELSELEVAGVYHDRGSSDDVLHVFGVTRADPPVFFYRTVEHVYRAEASSSVRKRMAHGPWKKVTVQIPVRKVSPVVFQSRLYVFWVEISTKPDQDGADFMGYDHRFTVKYTSLEINGGWSPPQTIDLGDLAHDKDELAHEVERLAVRTLITGLPTLDTPTDGAAIAQYQTALDAVLAAFHKVLKRDASILEQSSLWLDVGGSTGWVHLNPTLPSIRALLCPRHDEATVHIEPRADYGLARHPWERTYPEPFDTLLFFSFGDTLSAGKLDLYHARLDANDWSRRVFYRQRETRLWNQSRSVPDRTEVHAGWMTSKAYLHPYSQAVSLAHSGGSTLTSSYPILLRGPANAELVTVNGSPTDAIVDASGDWLYLHTLPGAPGDYILKRLGTSLGRVMARMVFEGGVETLLDVRTQEARLAERALPFQFQLDAALLNDAKPAIDRGYPDFTGPLGVYFREIFLHLPLLLAEHLNGEGKFAEAEYWYDKIFDPTSNAIPDVSAISDPVERARREKGRVWQYVEFRKHRLLTLREQLADVEALDVSETDPFNPHAIARRRLGAYMRGVFMKYVDNLIDWGDSLFAEDTMESINEATLLYVMAHDLLGPRPPELGECSEEESSHRTYDALVRRMDNCPDSPLAHLETLTSGTTYRAEAIMYESAAGEYSSIDGARVDGALALADPGELDEITRPGVLGDIIPHEIPLGALADFGSSLLRQVCVFCVPANRELLGLWDRVEDRLAKIRNCRNISGVRRELPLFAPEIDPRLLMRARALGVSLEDLLETTSGNLPPYRFAFLIARAKEYAATTQSLGAALLSALERRDAEELARLRQVQQQNVLAMSSQLRDQEVDAVSKSLDALVQRKGAIQSRIGYFERLIDAGLSGGESEQLGKLQDSLTIDTLASPLYIAAAVVGALPSILGMAASTGSREAALVLKFFTECIQTYSMLTQRQGGIAGIRAGYERRAEGWEYTLEQARNELDECEKLLLAQEVRVQMAERSREIHRTTFEQMQEVSEFYQTKFSNLELYAWLARTVQALHRRAYLAANEMARMAESAYRFERGDDTTPLLRGGYWDAGRTGLLAGEQLLADLRDLESRYVQTNYRSLEVDQAFSLAQIAPLALMELRLNGSCEFELPEAYFDLFYPGQYRRRIKSARLTIPSVTGPYTNVSATLTLLSSRIRKTPELGSEHLLTVPPTRTVSIATSSGQNDAGVFRLDFQDERYAPFEGAGAVQSRWKLTLPGAFRPFDYETINDVLLQVSYTADYDPTLREAVEARNADAEGTLLNVLTRESLPRTLSLRQEFSSSFHRLLHVPSTGGERVPFEISARHFPLFVQRKRIAITNARLLLEIDREALRRADGTLPATFRWPEIHAMVGGRPSGTGALTFAESAAFGGLPAAPLAFGSTIHLGGETSAVELRVAAGNDLSPAAPAPSDASPINEAKLRDVLLYFEYRIVE